MNAFSITSVESTTTELGSGEEEEKEEKEERSPRGVASEADLEESRRIIAAEVIRKLIDKVEILESLQASGPSTQVS